jgi:hypothetical protein
LAVTHTLPAALLALLLAAGAAPVRAGELEVVPCGREDWAGRLSLELGLRYFFGGEDTTQAVFGLEGRFWLFGPLSGAVSVDAGALGDPDLSVQAGLRLRVLRTCQLELALDARGGVWLQLAPSPVDVRGMFAAALEVMHDLGQEFMIAARLGGGMVVRDDRGGFLEAVLLLGYRFF